MSIQTVLFTGGCRSGKSALAQAFAERFPAPLLYLATAQRIDEEMAARISRHQAERGPNWLCMEEAINVPAALEKALSPSFDAAVHALSPGGASDASSPEVPATFSGKRPSAILLDCVTVWLGTLMALDISPADILPHVHQLAAVISRADIPVAIVTNEVGYGIVPSYPMGRAYRDLAGEANQILARACSHVVLAVCGLPMPVKPLGGPLP